MRAEEEHRINRVREVRLAQSEFNEKGASPTNPEVFIMSHYVLSFLHHWHALSPLTGSQAKSVQLHHCTWES